MCQILIVATILLNMKAVSKYIFYVKKNMLGVKNTHSKKKIFVSHLLSNEMKKKMNRLLLPI